MYQFCCTRWWTERCFARGSRGRAWQRRYTQEVGARVGPRQLGLSFSGSASVATRTSRPGYFRQRGEAAGGEQHEGPFCRTGLPRAAAADTTTGSGSKLTSKRPQLGSVDSPASSVLSFPVAMLQSAVKCPGAKIFKDLI
jgi:hypothetical protein